MAFKSNPLSLTVPEPAFESWLRDSGYLELLDQRSSSSSSAAAANNTAASSSSGNDAASDPYAPGFFASVFSSLGTLLSLATLNPLSKLTTDDFSRATPSWTHGFIGSFDSYSFPSSPDQARRRVHENVKRFARNYATLFILFFACAFNCCYFDMVQCPNGTFLFALCQLCCLDVACCVPETDFIETSLWKEEVETLTASEEKLAV
ncbi:hypothetical protein BT93_F1332 [Corymbia citriodora subsp. variegata]|nr:hypothetical protein BT93_F1332 [Corymbia citriodora subsp. variegata]